MVDGSYQIAVEAMGKTAYGRVILKSSGSGLEGSVQIMGMEVELEEGTCDGDSFGGKVTADTPMGTKRITISGSVKGDEVSGKLKAGLLGATFTGSRLR